MKRVSLSWALIAVTLAYSGAPAQSALPIAVIDASPKTGPAPLTVRFDGSRSYCSDPRNYYIIGYDWYVGDGSDTLHMNVFEYTYTIPGTYIVSLTAVQNAVDGSVWYQRGLPVLDTIVVSSSSAVGSGTQSALRNAVAPPPRASSYDLRGRQAATVMGVGVRVYTSDRTLGRLALTVTTDR